MINILIKLTNRELSDILHEFKFPETGQKSILIKRIYNKILSQMQTIDQIKKYPVSGLRKLVKIFFPSIDTNFYLKSDIVTFIYEHRIIFISETTVKSQYNDLTISELKDILRQHGLNLRGNKAELIARLNSSITHRSIELNKDPSRISSQYNQLSIIQLKDLLREKGLKVSGNKDELIDRLQKHLIGVKTVIPFENTQLSCNDLRTISRGLGSGTSGSKNDLIVKINKALHNPDNLKGYIYILQSPVYNGQIKIGETKHRQTLNHVKNRLYQRYRTALGPNIKFLLFPTSKRKAEESYIHEVLSKYRLPNSELFTVNLKHAIEVCEKITGSQVITF